MTLSFRLPRRAAIVATALVALAAAAPFAGAEAQQITQLKLMAPAAPGGGWDSTARQMQAALTQAGIVKNVQVANVTGAGGTIGLASLVNNMKGDGNQLMVNGLVMVGAILTNKSAVTLAQTTPIARLTGEYEVVVVPAASPIKTMKELADKIKANPGAVAIAGGSAGGTDHILAGLIAKDVGADPSKINYIPFSGGGEALAAIMGNHVAAGISGYGEFSGPIKAGRLRVLAISSDKRVPGLDIPTLKEGGVNIELANWRSVVAPPGLSAAQTAALIDVVDKMVKTPQWKAILEKNDWTDLYMPGDQFAAYMKAEDARTTDILKTIGLAK
ncbi:MAG TPA: tripartite tricarboxylate transporter substrate-binding protein [Alphaproteobacteria bacterium]|jgi:putative tricarboxylic transport membrane protein